MVFPTNPLARECPITHIVRKALDECDQRGIHSLQERVAYVYRTLTDAEEMENNRLMKQLIAAVVDQIERLYT